MSFIKSINTFQINDLIKSGSQRIFLSMPGLFLETVKVVIDKFQSGFENIKVIINCSEKIIRQGYGEIKAIQELRDAGVPVYDQPDNLVSFIIVDDLGYFLFPQSRIFLEESHNVRNAIEMDPFSMEQIVGIFFPPEPDEQKLLEDRLYNAVILSSQRINKIEDILGEAKNLHVSPLEDKQFISVREAIEKNPPMHPDLKRELDYYTTYFLWIEMKFTGANISKKTITIPKHVLPINSEDLRKKLSSQLKLFDNVENTLWYYKLRNINEAVNNLRKKYLTPVKAKDGKNIILKANLLSFNKEYDGINQNISKITDEVKQKIDEEIESTKMKFQKILIDYYHVNQTEELKKVPRSEKKAILEEFVKNVIKDVDFPEAEELLSGFSLSKQEFELTDHDLNNDKLIDELINKEILNDKDAQRLGKRGKGYSGMLF